MHLKLFFLNGFGYAADSLILLLQSVTAGQAALEFQPSFTRGLTVAAYTGMLVGALFWGLGESLSYKVLDPVSPMLTICPNYARRRCDRTTLCLQRLLVYVLSLRNMCWGVSKLVCAGDLHGSGGFWIGREFDSRHDRLPRVPSWRQTMASDSDGMLVGIGPRRGCGVRLAVPIFAAVYLHGCRNLHV